MHREENSYWREAASQRGEHEAQPPLEERLRQEMGRMASDFDLERTVAARPLLAFGTALAAGFLFGSVGDRVSVPYNRGHQWMQPLDEELNVVRSAALAVLADRAAANLRQLVPGQTGAALSAMVGRGLGRSGTHGASGPGQ
ncbi:MAG TPA: hypothetical protein VNL77_03030, partial [Roseiflexaceae bacterium]|nr:hypothetical protein [Roseiflexaceae bacterium]